MIQFILRDEPKKQLNEEHWQVVKLGVPSVVICEFIGSDKPYHLDKEIAPLVAGDYVAFLNEKYIDKEINVEWGKPDIEARYEYHAKMLIKYGNIIMERYSMAGKWKELDEKVDDLFKEIREQLKRVYRR